MSEITDAPLAIPPAPFDLLGDPLDFFVADHLRHRTAFAFIEYLANRDTPDRAAVTQAIIFLEKDMVAHVLDEEEDLFPLLRRRCEPEDAIELVLGDLSAEHTAEERIALDIRVGLAQALEVNCAIIEGSGLKERMLAFANAETRHLALENGIVLPLAWARLTEDDLRDLSRSMVRRRSVG